MFILEKRSLGGVLFRYAKGNCIKEKEPDSQWCLAKREEVLDRN